MSFLTKSHQIVLDRAVDTPGHGKYVVNGFNAVQKRYLATCLRMCSTPEVDKIDSNRMHVDDMNEKGQVSFPNNVIVYWIFVMKLVPRVIRNMRTLTINLIYFRRATHYQTSG